MISDGFPTSDTPPEYAVRVARMYGVPVYPVILGHRQVVQRAQAGGGGAWGGGPRGPAGRGGGAQTQIRMNRDRERLARGRAREQEMGVFASIGAATGGQAFDPPQVSNKALRKVFQGLAGQVRAEYLAGYYADSAGEERTPHQVEIRLSEAVKGKLYGGTRVIVH